MGRIRLLEFGPLHRSFTVTASNRQTRSRGSSITGRSKTHPRLYTPLAIFEIVNLNVPLIYYRISWIFDKNVMKPPARGLPSHKLVLRTWPQSCRRKRQSKCSLQINFQILCLPKNVVRGCVILTATHATFDHVFWPVHVGDTLSVLCVVRIPLAAATRAVFRTEESWGGKGRNCGSRVFSSAESIP